MKKLPPNPCGRKCEKRSWDCHTWCEKYKAYEQGNAEERIERWKQKQIDNYAIESIVEANIKRTTRKWGFKRGE